MKSEILSEQIMRIAKRKGLKHLSITNNCVLNFDVSSGKTLNNSIVGTGKRDLLQKIISY